MPVDDLAPRYRELGRLKFGDDLGDRPTQLDTWRLTSPDPHLIEAAARIFGGDYHQTEKGAEVVTETSDLEVLIPPQDVAAGQWYELWKAGGLERRCTGSAVVAFDSDSPDGWRKVAPCICNEENQPRACRITTVLRVLLPQLPDLGVWRLVTRSVYAAAELPPAVEVLRRLSDGYLAPAILGLEHRTTKRTGERRHNYMVPVLKTRESLGAMISAVDAGDPQALPFGESEPVPLAEQSPALTPPPTGSDPVSGLSDPPDGPEPVVEPPTTGRAVSESHRAAEARWRELRHFIEQTPPHEAPLQDREILIEILDELERLAVAAGLWTSESLDAATNRHLAGRHWTAESIDVGDLRAFTQRALMGAANDLTNHRPGRIMAGLDNQ